VGLLLAVVALCLLRPLLAWLLRRRLRPDVEWDHMGPDAIRMVKESMEPRQARPRDRRLAPAAAPTHRHRITLRPL
jgi:hypothetical protein